MILETMLCEDGLFPDNLNVIHTYSNRLMDITDPNPNMFCIADIAHALAQQPRFGGHLKVKYTVLAHSINTMMALKAAFPEAGKQVLLAALMHDASEAYLCDIPTPIKQHLSNYKQLEERVMRCIFTRFDIDFNLLHCNEVKWADRYMLAREWHEFRLNKPVKEKLFMFNKYPDEQFIYHFDKLYYGNDAVKIWAPPAKQPE
jgi:uncharacterized protein